MRRASLMIEILRDGRVLVDRDDRWRELGSQGELIEARAERDRRTRARRAREAVATFAAKADVIG